MEMIKLLKEQLEIIGSVVAGGADAELDLGVIEEVMIDAKAEIEEKDVKINELEGEISNLSEKSNRYKKLSETLTASLSNAEKEVAELKAVIQKDIQQKCIWLSDESILESFDILSVKELLELKKSVDEKFNKAFEIKEPEKTENEFADSDQLNNFSNF